MDKQPDTPIILIVLFLSIIVTGIIGYVIGFRANNTAPATTETADNTFRPSPIASPLSSHAPASSSLPGKNQLPPTSPIATPESTTMYRSADYGFTFKVPSTFKLLPHTPSMTFTDAAGHTLMSIEAFKDENAQSNYNLSCSFTSTPDGSPKQTPVPPSTPPMSGNVIGYRSYPDHSCWMVGTKLFINVYNRDETNANKPALSQAQLDQVLSTFQFTN